MDNLEITAGGELKYTDDVYTNSRELCMGGKLGRAIRLERMEYLGDILGYRGLAGMPFSHGHCI